MERLPGFNVANVFEKRALLIAINSIAALSIFFFGYDQGPYLCPQASLPRVMGGVNNAKHYIDLMGFGYVDEKTGNPVVTNSLLQGGIISVYYLGTLFGCLLGGWIGDKIGRIKTIALGAGWAIFGASLQTAAMNSNWMIGSRAVNGIGTGILNAVVPVWATETSEHTSRGQFIAIEFTLNIFGVVVAYWLEFGLSYNGDFPSPSRSPSRTLTSVPPRPPPQPPPPSNLKHITSIFPLTLGSLKIIPLLVLLGAVWFFPESPRYLVKAGRDEEAQYILRRLRGSTGDDLIRANIEYQEIRNVIATESQESKKTSYLHMLFGIGSGNLHTGRRVQLVIWLQILQEWVGIAGVTVYAPTIFRVAGFDSQKSQWISGLNNIFYAFATLICVFTLDRIGRRWTLWWGAAGQGIAMFLAGAFSQLGEDAARNGDVDKASSYGAAAASFVFIFTSIFGATWLTVPWLYPAEIFPLHVRSQGNAWGVVGWSIGIGATTLHIFGIANIISIPVVWALYPETNQRTLEEVDLLFASPSPWVWDAEKTFARLKAEQPVIRVAKDAGPVGDIENRRGSD
ncbi:hypothetical protein EKO27_g4459 [Xylaria grammica]|uniref:Major facilitator superfamily (MFS) profile domain-containing protein n=1 Tax=Xylaria grammica TaxID=363999 RepID=A0A439D8C8_9PEZI|nr:hypothetical protein EKO27_g4459 [Xylaria grammica]